MKIDPVRLEAASGVAEAALENQKLPSYMKKRWRRAIVKASERLVEQPYFSWQPDRLIIVSIPAEKTNELGCRFYEASEAECCRVDKYGLCRAFFEGFPCWFCFWEFTSPKAEYVMRETERRRLHQIFIENFSERFRELKPEVAETQNSDSVFTRAEDSAVENHKSVEQPLAPVAARSGEIKSPASVENVVSPVSPEASATEVEGKKDEFLGFSHRASRSATSGRRKRSRQRRRRRQ